ncbi:hypothetical protein AB3Z07_21130 [Metabacillus halosaccharovorans]|uniref:hypothetical protein n=1 Tax=Metabacillus halosaccharovorans TaxID=930124 RepID=UPI0034CD134E
MNNNKKDQEKELLASRKTLIFLAIPLILISIYSVFQVMFSYGITIFSLTIATLFLLAIFTLLYVLTVKR